MVPGALSTVTPARRASPERGRTCPSWPAGMASASPVGTAARSPGARRSGSSMAADRSMPAACSVIGRGRTASALSRLTRRTGRSAFTSPDQPLDVVRAHVERLLAGQADLAVAIDVDDLDDHLVPLVHHVGDLAGALLGQLADVDEAVGAGQDLDEGAELDHPLDHALVELADLRLHGEALDEVDGALQAARVRRGDRHHAGVVHVDGGAGLLHDGADGLAAGADDVADLVRLDGDLHDAR